MSCAVLQTVFMQHHQQLPLPVSQPNMQVSTIYALRALKTLQSSIDSGLKRIC